MWRLDAAVARLLLQQSSSKTPKTLADFMPTWAPPEDAEPASPQAVLAFLTASVKKKT